MRPTQSARRDGVGRPLQVMRSKGDLNLYKIILALWKEQELYHDRAHPRTQSSGMGLTSGGLTTSTLSSTLKCSQDPSPSSAWWSSSSVWSCDL